METCQSLKILSNKKEYYINRSLANECHLFKDFPTQVNSEVEIPDDFPFEVIYNFLNKQTVCFDYSLFKLESYYNYPSFFDYLIKEMAENFDIDEIKSLNNDLQWNLSFYIPYQLTSNLTYKKWLDHNLKYFKDGLYSILDIKNNIPYQYHWDSNNKKLIMTYENERTEVRWFNFNENILESISRYKDRKINGKQQAWYKNSQKLFEANYENGYPHGKYESWYENGQKQYEDYFQNDRRCGKYKIWYENGNKSCEHNYVNGLLHGEYQGWKENGERKYNAYYENGELCGKFINYTLTGQ